jgi:hypothetical protein
MTLKTFEDFPDVDEVPNITLGTLRALLAERDALRDQLAAARNEALEEAFSVAEAKMKEYAKDTYSGEPVRSFRYSEDTLSQSAAKCYCAGGIAEAILALKSTSPAPREVTVQEAAWYVCPNDDTALNYLESVYGNDLRCAVSCMLDALRALANEEQSDG